MKLVHSSLECIAGVKRPATLFAPYLCYDLECNGNSKPPLFLLDMFALLLWLLFPSCGSMA
eukprot:1463369-Amphidinium_carterae.1